MLEWQSTSLELTNLALLQVQRDKPVRRDPKDCGVRLVRPAARGNRVKRGRMDQPERRVAADRLVHPARRDPWETKAQVVSGCLCVVLSCRYDEMR